MKNLLLASLFLVLPTMAVEAPDEQPTEQTAETVSMAVSLPVGAVHTLLLNGNPTTGFMWKVASQSGDAVRVETGLMKPETQANGKVLCGAPTPTKVTLTAEKPGESVIVLEYRRAWETDRPAAQTLTCRVSVSAE